MLGAVQPCIICREPRCLREQLACDRCNAFCWICCTTKADENCGRCQRAARKLLASTEKSSKAKHLRLSAIVDGAESLTRDNAKKLLKPSGVSVALIFSAAGGGEAGASAYKRAALTFASMMQRVSQDGGDVKTLFASKKLGRKTRDSRSRKARRGGRSMSAPVAAQAIADLGEGRLVEPFNRDKPAVALAVAAELFETASKGEKDALVVAELSSANHRVNAFIVQQARRSTTHKHGWSQSKIEALENFARDEAKKAIKHVRARSRAAVEERRAKEPPKKKRARAALAASKATTKVAKAKGTYKNPRTGDTKKHFKRQDTGRDRQYRARLAFNKVERHGAAACSPLEIERHAAHKKHLEACEARRAARKAKK